MSAREFIFEHTDDEEDRIRIEHIDEGVSPKGRRLMIYTSDLEDGDRVQVVMGRDDALRLAKAITDTLAPGLTVEQLDAMTPVERVADAAGQQWTKTKSGDWYSTTTWMDITSSELHDYGPIRRVYAHPDTTTPEETRQP